MRLEYNGQLQSLRVTGAVGSEMTNSDLSTSDDLDENINDVPLNEIKIIYETTEVLYQRWNNIVINYDDGYLDVFLNGDLVGSLSGVTPYISFDNIISGSPNGILGGICNVTYYEKALKKNDIELSYKSLRDKNPPYIWSIKDDFNHAQLENQHPTTSDKTAWDKFKKMLAL